MIAMCHIIHLRMFHVADDPNGSLYMLCGVLIAMLLVGVIIVLLAVTIRYVNGLQLRSRQSKSQCCMHVLRFGLTAMSF